MGSHRSTVGVLQTVIVKPLKQTPRHVMYMSPIDQIFRMAPPSRTILFYGSEMNTTVAVEAFQAAIASVLVSFYPLAGRLVHGVDGRLAIDCNDEGVNIIHASCELPFTELQSNNFDIQPLFRQLVPMDDLPTSDNVDGPLACFQVTSFKGGLSVGISMLHTVADGHSMWTFIKAVSQTCRAEPLRMQPIHARYLLKPDVFLSNNVFPSNSLLDPRKNSNDVPYNGCEDGVPAEDLSAELLHQSVIHFSRYMIEILKNDCSAGLANLKAGTSVSSFQALGAYIWKRLTMAQKLDKEDGVDFRIAMDVRGKIIPPLTSAYFGNAVVGIPTPLTAGQLLEESLGEIADRLRQSIEKGNDVYIKAALIAREKADFTKITRLRKVKVMNLRNARGFAVYEGGDFGWGGPDAVRPPWETREGEFTWYPGKEEQSIDVIAAMSEETHVNFFSSNLYPNDPLKSYFPCSSVKGFFFLNKGSSA